MPASRRPGPFLERIAAFSFADPVPPPDPDQRESLHERMAALYGTFTDLSWLTGGAMVSYHRMARTVVRDLGADLAGVDLVITVDASPDCRHQSFPGPVLAHLLPGDPVMLGVSEQGVAGPFTALRIALRYLRSGAADRALILIMEQSTLPPDDAAVRPVRDVAVALLLGPDGVLGVDTPAVTVTRAAPATPSGTDADLVVAGAAVTVAGMPVRRAEPGHPCAGVWLALADLLADPPAGRRILVAERDPVLPYECAVTLTRQPADRPASPAARPRRVRELVR